ncbi:MAG: MFS transporter [Myxococcales bacterium]|nr:MFS transporter [Myxococcales bacterium]
MTKMMQLLKTHHQLRRLWLAEVVSMAGDWLSFVAISLLALHSGQGALALASVLVLHTLPHALFSPMAGLLADRLEARRWMQFAALGEAGLTVGLLLAAYYESLLVVQVLVFVRASVSAMAYPTWGVALRHLVDDQDLVSANALNAATWSVMFSVGMALGGVLSLLGPEIALGIDALTFVVAAGILGGLPAMPPPEMGETEGLTGALRDGAMALPAAIAEVRTDPVLIEAVIAKANVTLAGAGVWLLIHLEAEWLTGAATTGLGLGLLHALRGIGTGIGPTATASWLGTPTVGALRAAQVLTAVGLLVTAVAPWPGLALVGVFVWGLGTGSNWTLSSSLLQLRTRRAYLGRVGALDGALRTTALSVSVLFAAAAVDGGVSVRSAALATMMVGVLVWTGFRLRHARQPSLRTTAL